MYIWEINEQYNHKFDSEFRLELSTSLPIVPQQLMMGYISKVFATIENNLNSRVGWET